MAQLLPENSTLERAVRRAAEQGRLSHAIVLSGDGGLTDAARFIAAAHVCEGTDRPCLRCRHCRKVLEGIHPDVSVIRDTEHRELTVDAVRALRQDVYIRPNEAARKVYIIADSRQLNERDQNVLLKIVEEGPEAEQLCRAFARGKLLPVTTYLVSLENRRMKREELRDVLRGAWCAAAEALLLQMGKAVPDPACGETAQALAGGLDRRRLYGLTALLEKYSGECVYNVGAGHVLGALAVEWEELL